MSLRLRLIVVFFLLSVVPLAAVTYSGYQTSVRTLREVAQREAELLAGELTQRMQLVTTQISERAEQLMMAEGAGDVATLARTASDPRPVPSSTPSAPAPAPTAPAAPVAPPTPTLPPSVTDMVRMTDAVGQFSMMFNNIEFRGLNPNEGRRGGGRGPGGPPGGASGATAGGGGRSAFPARDGGDPDGRDRTRGGRSGPPPPGAPPPVATLPPTTGTITTASPTPPGDASSPSAAPMPPAVVPAPETTAGGAGAAALPGASIGPAPSGRGGRGEPGGPGGNRGGGPPGFGGPGGPGGPGGQPPTFDDSDPSRIRIDLRQIRGEMIRQLVPEGKWETLTPEERQKVFAEVNQRILGFVQGVQQSAAEVQRRAAEVQRATAARDASATAASGSVALRAPVPTSPVAPVAKTPLTPVAPATKAPATATAAAPPSASAPSTAKPAARAQRTTNITGTRLDVRVERNGEVRQMNAEINLDNLLGTVFGNTRRDRGEVAFAVNPDGQIYTPTEADKPVVQSFGNAVQPKTATGTTVLPAWIVVTTADPSGTGLKFGIARPVGDSMSSLYRSSAQNAALGLGFIGLALIGIVPIATRLTRNLSTLSEGVRRIAHGDYRARVAVKTRDEFGELASAFNQMAEDVEKHQRSAVEQERIKRELELGRQIQHDMLPHTPLKQGLTEIRGVSVPAREVGGDFFNYFVLPSGQIALLVGDVSGKGVGAALLMANIQASLRTRLALGQDLAALATEIDGDIESNTPGPVYATLFVGIFDPVARMLRFVNAGHNPQYVLRRDGGLERMMSSGLPVGLISGRGYSEQYVQLAAGDLLFFYTDGCVEAENEAGEEFTSERLESLLIEATKAGTVDVLARVESVVADFRGKREPFDDATMMAVKVG